MRQDIKTYLDLAPAQHHPQLLPRHDNLALYRPVLVIVFEMRGLVDEREPDEGRALLSKESGGKFFVRFVLVIYLDGQPQSSTGKSE